LFRFTKNIEKEGKRKTENQIWKKYFYLEFRKIHHNSCFLWFTLLLIFFSFIWCLIAKISLYLSYNSAFALWRKSRSGLE
jgi:hypothetical protein